MHRNTGRVDLRETGIREAGTLAVALESGRTVRSHRVGRKEEHVAVTARSDHYGVCAETLQFTGHQISGDDTSRLAVLDHDVEHLVTGIALHRTGSDLLVECGISAQQQLLTGLAASIERTRNLRTAERTVVQHTAVLACERNALADALVDDAVRNFGHAVNIGFTGAVVTAFDRIVEQPVNRIVVVAVVLGRIDTALRRDRMRTARRVLDAENLHVVSQFAERSGCGGTAQARTYDDNIQFAFVGRAYYLDRRLVVAPLLREFPGGYF